MPRVMSASMRLRGPDDDIDEETEQVRQLGGQRTGGLRELLKPQVRPAVTMGILLAVFQQITGVNTVIYYAPTLLAGAGLGSSSAILAEVAVGGVNVLLTVVAVWLMDRVGRRPLLLIGTTGMLVGLLTVACAFLGGDHLTGSAAIVAIVGLMFFQGSFAIGLGPVFWLLIAEIYPLKVRGTAMGVATIANWGADFIVTISFLTLLNAISGAGTFLLFAFLTLVALIYFRIKVPETKGRSLQEIESELETVAAA